MHKLELHTAGSPPCPTTGPDDDAAWAKWTVEHRVWRQHKDAVLSTAIFALDEQVNGCGLLEGDCEVCDLSAEARKLLWDALSPEGRDAVETVRRILPMVEAALG